MDRIRSLTFRYSTGNMRDSFVSYILREKNGGYSAVIIPDGVGEENACTVTVPEVFAEKVLSVLKQYHVGRWNSFHKVNKHILDGRSFTLAVHFANGKEIYAHGYMRYPKHYREVRDALNACFMRLYVPQE